MAHFLGLCATKWCELGKPFSFCMRLRHSKFVIPSQGGMPPAFMVIMPSAATTVSQPPPDITFTCRHCSSALVVDAAAAGMTLDCQRCGKPTPVPPASIRQTDAAEGQVADLKRQLKENESQRTEINSYINQLSIQLHRWQLRLQTLNERKKELEAELHDSK